MVNLTQQGQGRARLGRMKVFFARRPKIIKFPLGSNSFPILILAIIAESYFTLFVLVPQMLITHALLLTQRESFPKTKRNKWVLWYPNSSLAAKWNEPALAIGNRSAFCVLEMALDGCWHLPSKSIGFLEKKPIGSQQVTERLIDMVPSPWPFPPLCSNVSAAAKKSRTLEGLW